ncbi:PaaX family transcriptional regulator [Cryptosporangium aurantiacum]|uniref:Transcriptional regulator, PaaX family n=1 Tax=Cryptosporangium aurantiacum TaxID=134849 RepID=A0A1M7RG85_9ACTN|nr:PaaX family transcriptional regulator C-terminal domain-containing protein [Cryptosporangium aurantiacum]SHN45293.1 transcriptional regulator, PaaX family [Cryptosporangium aurantiacum]
MILDDTESSPGSTTSLLRTIVGTSLRRLGGWIAVAHLVELAGTVGLPEARTRTALARIKAKGLLAAQSRDGVPGYALVPDAIPMLERGDRRIFHPRTMADGDRWCLISYSVPEENRDLRHQLRRRLTWIGCGAVSPALWICPEYLTGEVEEILADLGLSSNATVFLATEVRGPADVTRWWDLGSIRARHDAFLAAHGDTPTTLGDTPEDAFRAWIHGLDSWRIIPYIDPGLPARLLPADWPGHRSVALFLELRDHVLPRAHAYAEQVTGAAHVAP